MLQRLAKFCMDLGTRLSSKAHKPPPLAFVLVDDLDVVVVRAPVADKRTIEFRLEQMTTKPCGVATEPIAVICPSLALGGGGGGL